MEEKKEFFVCKYCKNNIFTIPSNTKKDNIGNSICDECFDDNYFYCDDCGEITHNANSHSVNDGRICGECFDNNYFYCDNCNTNLHNDYYGNNNLCSDCNNNNDDDDSQSNHNYYKGDDLVTKGHRPYSCEIECYYPEDEGYRIDTILSVIDNRIGMTDDGSLNDRGKEFQTPKLSGTKGDKVLRQLCKSLSKNNFYVDTSCGLHIHLDTADLAGDIIALKKIILFYLIIEPVIYSFLPFSRRTSTYCLPLSQFYQENEIKNCDTIEQLEQIWYREQSRDSIEDRKKDKYDGSRYAGVNLHSLLANGHIEIRHHSGTIDYLKISNWIKLHIAILDIIPTIELSEIIKLKYILELYQKQEAMFSLLKLDNKLVKYFKARAEKFSKELKDDKNICVE